MENKKTKFEELRQFIISEAIKVLNEDEISNDVQNDEIDSNNPVDLGEPNSIESPEEKSSEFSNITAKVQQLSKKIDDDELIDLDEVIDKAISTGRLEKSFNYNKMAEGSKIHQFNYITTALASLYHSNDTPENEKANIRKALWEAMAHPYEITTYEKGQGEHRPSLLSAVIAKNAGINDFRAKSKTIDGSYYTDIIADSLFKAIDYMLDNFKIEGGSAFPTSVIWNAASRTISEVQSKSAKTAFTRGVGGRDYIKSSSIDEPLGDSDEESDSTKADRFTGEEGGKSTAQKEAAKELSDTMKEFVEGRLESNIKHGGINPSFLEVAKLLFQGHNLSEISDILGRPAGTVRQIKKRMEEVITFYVQNGSFQKYVKDKTGIKIKFPNNKYTFSVQGTGETGEKETPLEYFESNGIDPATGEPKGEWVPIKIGKEDEEEGGGFYDKYGSLVFGDEEKGDDEENNTQETETENPDDLGPEDEALTESFIAKELMKRVNKRILKEFKK